MCDGGLHRIFPLDRFYELICFPKNGNQETLKQKPLSSSIRGRSFAFGEPAKREEISEFNDKMKLQGG